MIKQPNQYYGTNCNQSHIAIITQWLKKTKHILNIIIFGFTIIVALNI